MGSTRHGFHEEEHHTRHQWQGEPLHVRLDFGTAHRLEQGHDAQANPHGKGVEGPDVRVVPLTRLQRRLVQVDHNRNACHQKEQPHHGGPFRVAERLECQSDQAQNQRQVKEAVPAAVVHHLLGERVPVAQALGVDEVDPAQPISIHEVAVALDVVLLSNEVPEEVPEIHPAHLEVREKSEIFTLGRHQLFERFGQATFRLQCPAHVILVARLVGALRGPAQVLLLGALGALQTLHMSLSVFQTLVELVDDVPREAGTHLRIVERCRVHLSRFRVAHQKDVVALNAKVRVKPLPVIGEQAAKHTLELRLGHACCEDVVLQVRLEFRTRHGHLQQRAGVVRRRIESFVIAPLLVLPNVRSRGAVHPREDHGEVRVVVGLRAPLFAAVHVFLNDEVLLTRIHLDEVLRRVLAFEALDPSVDRTALLHDAVALDPRGLAIEVRLVQCSRSVPKLTGRQGAVSILLAAEVAQQGEEVLGIVFIHGRVRRRTDHDGCKRTVAQEHHGHAQRERVGGPPSLAL